MTGRELIIYILENHLEDEPVIQGDKILGFLDINEAAQKFNVGPATVFAYTTLGYLKHDVLHKTLLIPANAEVNFPPKE